MKHYRPLTESLATGFLKALKLNKHQRASYHSRGVLKQFADELKSHLSSFEHNVIMEEITWADRGRHVVLLQTDSIADTIAQTTFKVDVADGLAEAAPLSFFRVAMPDGFKLAGLAAPPLQVAIYPIVAINGLFDPLRQIGLIDGEVHGRDLLPNEMDSSYFSVCYPISLPGQPTSIGRITVPMTRLPTALTASHLQDALPLHGQRLSDIEEAQQFSVLQFAVRLVLLMIARPDMLSAGLPGKSVSTMDRATEVHHQMSEPSNRGHRPGTYRRGFFRQLRSERFYGSSEWRDKPRGSRFVYVSDTIVGGDEIHVLSDM